MNDLRPARNSAFKKACDDYIEETVTDEQVWRILEPIIRLIKQGAFDRPRRFFFLRERKRA